VVIVAAVALRFYSGWSEEPVTVSDTANLRSMLGVLAGLAVLSLSYRRIPNNTFTHRVVALTGVTGSLVAMLARDGNTAEDRLLPALQSIAWRSGFVDSMPYVSLIGCQVFTHLLTRFNLLMATLRERSRLLQHGALHDDLAGLQDKKPSIRHLRPT